MVFLCVNVFLTNLINWNHSAVFFYFWFFGDVKASLRAEMSVPAYDKIPYQPTKAHLVISA